MCFAVAVWGNVGTQSDKQVNIFQRMTWYYFAIQNYNAVGPLQPRLSVCHALVYERLAKPGYVSLATFTV